MKERKPKVRKLGKNGGSKITVSSLMFALLSLFLTVALFFGLIILQNYLSDEIVYQQVVVAKQDIPANVIITEENAYDLLTVKQVNILDVTKGTLTTADAILGQKTKVDLFAGEIITLKDVENISAYTRDFKEPVEISINIDNIANADGGKIRAGDLVNVTMMFTNEQLGLTGNQAASSLAQNSSVSLFSNFEKTDTNSSITINSIEDAGANGEEIAQGTEGETFTEENLGTEEAGIGEEAAAIIEPTPTPVPNVINATELISEEVAINDDSGTKITKYNYDTWAQYVMENIYVSKVLNSSGLTIASNDMDSNASIVIFTIEKADEADINNAIMNCVNMRISKVLSKPDISENPIPETDKEGELNAQ